MYHLYRFHSFLPLHPLSPRKGLSKNGNRFRDRDNCRLERQMNLNHPIENHDALIELSLDSDR